MGPFMTRWHLAGEDLNPKDLLQAEADLKQSLLSYR